MKWLASLSLLVAAVSASPIAETNTLEKRAAPIGIDVSGYQPSINWATAKANGVAFAYIKATEGTGSLTSIYLALVIWHWVSWKMLTHFPLDVRLHKSFLLFSIHRSHQ